MSDVTAQITHRIAHELAVPSHKVAAALRLLDEGATVPFIARYRKEATGGLDDGQLRLLEERQRYLRELEADRGRVLAAIDEQGKLTEGLRARILAAETKARLEDLYLPYRKKRRTKAQKAREAGLEPLLDLLLEHPQRVPEAAAAAFVDAGEGVADAAGALDGARQVLMERLSEDADLMAMARDRLAKRGRLVSTVTPGQEDAGATFRDYFDFSEPYATIPSHRILALLRGREQGVLSLALQDEDHDAALPWLEQLVRKRAGIVDRGRPADAWLVKSAHRAWRVKVRLRCELALMTSLRQRAEEDAIAVFADNLRDLLLAAPAGPRTTLGLDPGIRTGVKVAVVDRTGKLVETATIYPHPPRRDWQGSLAVLAGLVARHDVELIAIGNGTASRETDKLAAELIQATAGRRLTKVMVNEAGASVYSASALAAAELPGVDVTLRGAASIARRLQDPLAELVKIDPRSIGVGQYQHDVSAVALARSLDAVVEDCVNAVGVDLNTASPALLARVAGLSPRLAEGVVAWRDANGAFTSRKQLRKVPRLGAKTFEQCAGFLRIRGGDNPLDASSVHPEAYELVERIAARCRRPVGSLIGDSTLLRSLRPEQLTDARFGVPTVKDILAELDKPGRDPRPSFRTATFAEGVETLADLTEGMRLEGVVTNVTAFGAFVDVGVHQDGLVHISQLADRFISDPREVVKAGDVVSVRVISVDTARKRIALTMRSDSRPQRSRQQGAASRDPQRQRRQGQRHQGQRHQGRSRQDRSARPPKDTGFGSLGDLFGGGGRKR